MAIITSRKYVVQHYTTTQYIRKMTLTIKNFAINDAGAYECVAKNSLGEVRGSIRVYGKFLTKILVNLTIRR